MNYLHKKTCWKKSFGICECEKNTNKTQLIIKKNENKYTIKSILLNCLGRGTQRLDNEQNE